MGLSGIAIFLMSLPALLILLLCLIFSAVGGLLPATALTSAPLLAPAPRLVPMVLGLLMQGSNLGQVVAPVTIGATGCVRLACSGMAGRHRCGSRSCAHFPFAPHSRNDALISLSFSKVLSRHHCISRNDRGAYLSVMS